MSSDRLNTRFLRYVLARVENLLASAMNQLMKHDMKELVTARGAVNGFHVEHILADNSTNRKLFGDDEERFEAERNRLGGLLLMRGKDNMSSGNELFAQKLHSYAGTLYWNETLRADNYKSKLDFKSFLAATGLPFTPLKRFGPEELESRHRLLFEVCKHIWSYDKPST